MPKEVLETQIINIKGKPFKLSDYKGKVVLLNLWATWCGPCRMEMPELVKISEEFKGQDLEVIGLNISPDRDSPERINNFIQRFNIPYTIGIADEELAFSLMSESSSIPQSFLITRDGKIYRRFIGYNMRTTPQQLRQAIQEALNLKS
jgi:thiol-disulfide isomerase/thioredoxin